MQMNNTHQQEQTDKDPFVLSLSISTETARSKKEAESITKFRIHKNIPINETSLSPILTKHLQSTNLWHKKSNDTYSSCNIADYKGMTGIIVDYDNTMTIQQFKHLYSKYHFVLYPSSNHGKKDEHGLKMEKFHVLFPIDPKEYDIYSTNDIHTRAYQ